MISAKRGSVTVASVCHLMPANVSSAMLNVWNASEVYGRMVN